MSYTLKDAQKQWSNPYFGLSNNNISNLTADDDVDNINSTIKPIDRKDNNCGIYRFTNKISNRVYIGSSIDLKTRYETHLRGKGSKLLNCAFKKYNKNNFYYEILEPVDFDSFDSKTKLLQYVENREQIYLDFYFAKEFIETNGKNKLFRNLTYNLNPITKGGKGNKWTQESKDKLIKKFKEQGHTCVGRVITEETRNKIKETHKKRNVSKGINNPNYGKKETVEKREKKRNSMIKSGVIYEFYSIDNFLNVNGPFLNLTQFCKDRNLIKRGIQLCFTGKSKHYFNLAYCKKDMLNSKLEDIKQNPNYFKK